MGRSETDATNKKSNIQCIEVLIFKNHMVNMSNNLMWTLSVYSLENQPVRRNRVAPGSEMFHFMVYDWKRTIKQLLEDNQVPYSVIQFFSPDNLYSDSVDIEIHSTHKEIDCRRTVESISTAGVNERPVQRTSLQKDFYLMH